MAGLIRARPLEGTLAAPKVLAERVDALDAPHMSGLNVYVERLHQRNGEVPFFDLFDGGSTARLLLLLETPGRSAATVRFTSRDNPTGTARTLRKLFIRSGICRSDTVIWNAVPWVIQATGKRRARHHPRNGQMPSANSMPCLRIFPSLKLSYWQGAWRRHLRRLFSGYGQKCRS